MDKARAVMASDYETRKQVFVLYQQGSMDESRAVTVNTGLRKLLHFESLQAVKAEQLQLKQPMDSI